jgi:hypothetical protein
MIFAGEEPRESESKSVPVPVCPPQIPHRLPWKRNRALAVGSRRLSAWVMSRSRIAHRSRGGKSVRIIRRGS